MCKCVYKGDVYTNVYTKGEGKASGGLVLERLDLCGEILR